MSLRVAMLTLYPLDESQVKGGIGMVSLNLARALGEATDLDLHVVHCHGDCKEERVEERDGYTVHYLATPRSHVIPNLTASVSRVRRWLREMGPDVVHAHVGHLAYAGVREGLPVIYTIHGVVAREREIYSRRLYDRLRYGLLDHYERRALPKVDRLIAISDHVRDAYEERRADQIRGVPWSRIDNPVPPAFFRVEDASDEPAILYAGSITEIKDLHTLLRAVDRLRSDIPDVRLRIAGRVTSEAYRRELQMLVCERALGEHVRFLGLLDREQLLREYSRASLVALSSLQENSPMAVIEAMAAGKPVVATAVGGVPGLVDDGETGYLVPARDDKAMANAMHRLLGDDDVRRRMGKQAREIAQQRFGAAKVAESYLSLYRQCVAERAVASRGG